MSQTRQKCVGTAHTTDGARGFAIETLQDPRCDPVTAVSVAIAPVGRGGKYETKQCEQVEAGTGGKVEAYMTAHIFASYNMNAK